MERDFSREARKENVSMRMLREEKGAQGSLFVPSQLKYFPILL